jgi:integrase
MATIFKRKNSRYWWINYRDQYGRLVQKSLKVTYQPDARKLKRHYEAVEKIAHVRGTSLQEEIRFDDWFKEYQERRRHRVARSTYIRENQAVRNLKKALKTNLLSKIERNDIERWYDSLLKDGRTATANCLLRHIKVFFNHAVQEKYLSVSPALNVKPVKEVIKKVRIFSKNEINLVMRVMPERWQDLVRVAMNTGARSGEICRLERRDIDLESANSNVMIRSTQNNPTKSKKSRVVPLPAASLSFFSRIVSGKKPADCLLVNPHGNKWTTGWISKGFSKHCKKAGVEDCTFHDLRRTYGAWLVMNGADLVTVQENLGHSDIKVTIRHYTHLVIGHRARQTDKLPQF